MAREYCKGGATDEELAERLGIHRSTLYRWYAEHPEFREAVRVGKDVADERVLMTFYRCCVGYERTVTKAMAFGGVPFLVSYRESVLPDPAACYNWLKNRRPNEWRDRREVAGAPDASPVSVEVRFLTIPPKDEAIPYGPQPEAAAAHNAIGCDLAMAAA